MEWVLAWEKDENRETMPPADLTNIVAISAGGISRACIALGRNSSRMR